MAVSIFRSSREFEELMPAPAGETAEARRFFREETTTVTERATAYANDEVIRQQIDEEAGYEGHLAEEEERREEAMMGAQLLIRNVEEARAEGKLREDLLADAFGIACWSIGVPPGAKAPAERLALLGDVRLRFIVGYAAPAVAASLVPDM